MNVGNKGGGGKNKEKVERFIIQKRADSVCFSPFFCNREIGQVKVTERGDGTSDTEQ